MGCCCSSQPADAESIIEERGGNHVPRGGNKPFKRKNLKWTADVPITVGQLQLQREGFWDTAPSYEGRREIWQALRAAAEAEDLKLAQSILDAANITMPTGNPADGCYDELGNRYLVPLYCLVEPTNLIRNTDGDDNDDESSSSNAALATTFTAIRDIIVPVAGESSSSSISPAPVIPSSTQSTPSISTPIPISISSAKPSSIASSSSTPVPTSSTTTNLADGDHPILIRLSSGRDIPISILSDGTETILSLRMRIYAQAGAGFSRETHNIRFFYLGRVLEDKMRINKYTSSSKFFAPHVLYESVL